MLRRITSAAAAVAALALTLTGCSLIPGMNEARHHAEQLEAHALEFPAVESADFRATLTDQFGVGIDGGIRIAAGADADGVADAIVGVAERGREFRSEARLTPWFAWVDDRQVQLSMRDCPDDDLRTLAATAFRVRNAELTCREGVEGIHARVRLGGPTALGPAIEEFDPVRSASGGAVTSLALEWSLRSPGGALHSATAQLMGMPTAHALRLVELAESMQSALPDDQVSLSITDSWSDREPQLSVVVASELIAPEWTAEQAIDAARSNRLGAACGELHRAVAEAGFEARVACQIASIDRAGGAVVLPPEE